MRSTHSERIAFLHSGRFATTVAALSAATKHDSIWLTKTLKTKLQTNNIHIIPNINIQLTRSLSFVYIKVVTLYNQILSEGNNG